MPTPGPYRFHAAEVSYFSAKVRPALRFKALHYSEVLPDYRGVILPRTGLAFIPVLVTPEDDVLQDTSDILDALEARHPKPALYPTTPVQRLVAYLWELYADEFMILPAMHYRWSFPESEAKARRDFGALSGDFDAANQFADRMSGSLPMIGVTKDTAPAIEAHLSDLLDAMSEHLAVHPFLLGDRPSLADCALMGPLYAHLYLDAVPGRLLRETAPRVCHWIERMNRPDPQAPGDWLDKDALASTHRPLLELIGRDAVPYVLDAVAAFEDWADERPSSLEEPPRGVAKVRTALRGVEFDRGVQSYSLYMLQRPLDAYLALSQSERAQVDEAVEGTGCEELLRYEPRHRLGKRNYKLVFKGE